MTLLSRLSACVILCGLACSFTFADSTGSFVTQYAAVQQQFTTLTQDLESPAFTGNYNNMISLLSCMQISVPTNDTTYKDIIKKLKSDFDRDFATSGTGSASDLIRLDFYAQSLASLKTSLSKDRQDRQALMQWIVSKNQTLFNQLYADKTLLDSVLTAYADWSQKVTQYRALYGYTINQYDAIVANYSTTLETNLTKQLSQIQSNILKKNTTLSGLVEFSHQQKKIYLSQFALDMEKFFTDQVWGSINIDAAQRYQVEVDSIKSTFYSGSMLQCGLLTSLNQEKRSYYQTLSSNLRSQQVLLQSMFSTWSMTGTKPSTGANTSSSSQGLFTSGSQSLLALNNRYAQTSKTYQALYTNALWDYVALLSKVARAEQSTVAEFDQMLEQYRTLSGQEKIDLKAQLVWQILRFEKSTIVSTRAAKSLERIKKSLGIGKTTTKVRTIKAKISK